MRQLLIRMLTTGLVTVIAAPSFGANAPESVTVPWNQFQELYREHLKQELQKKYKPEKKEILPAELTKSQCRVIFDRSKCRIIYSVYGRRGNQNSTSLLSGNPAISSPESTGCARLQRLKSGIGILFAADGNPDFSVKFTVSVPVSKDKDGSYFTNITIPQALSNELRINFKDNLKLLSGLTAADLSGEGGYFVSPGEIKLLAIDKDADKVVPKPDLNLMTTYGVGENRLQMRVLVSVNPGSNRTFTLRLPAGTRYSRGMLPGFAQPKEPGSILFNVPDKLDNFILRCSIDLSKRTRIDKLFQPYIKDNNGKEGFFKLEQPVAAEIGVMAEGMQDDYFNPGGNAKSVKCLSAPIGSPLQFKIKELSAVKQPEVIVDSIFFCSALEENGSVMSVLSFDYPGGGQLKLKKIGSGELWRFAVNGQKSGIYEDGDYWRINLPPDRKSNKVEMAFLGKSTKPGIQGIYKSTMPDCGLNARTIIFSAVLPKRLELRGFEGGIDPLPSNVQPPHLPDGISGNCYNFYRPYYRGGRIDAEIFYREPPEKQ